MWWCGKARQTIWWPRWCCEWYRSCCSVSRCESRGVLYCRVTAPKGCPESRKSVRACVWMSGWWIECGRPLVAAVVSSLSRLDPESVVETSVMVCEQYRNAERPSRREVGVQQNKRGASTPKQQRCKAQARRQLGTQELQRHWRHETLGWQAHSRSLAFFSRQGKVEILLRPLSSPGRSFSISARADIEYYCRTDDSTDMPMPATSCCTVLHYCWTRAR